MNLEEIYFVSQIIAAIAIVASLLFVGIQVRLADQTRRIELIFARAARAIEHTMALASAENIGIWDRGMAGDPELTSDEFNRFRFLYAARMVGFEAVFLEHEARAIDADTFEPNMRAARQMISSNGGRAMWKIVKPTFHRRHVAWTESEFPGSQGTLRGGYEAWKTAVAESGTSGSEISSLSDGPGA